MGLLVDSVRNSLQKELKEKDEEIVNMRKTKMDLIEKGNSLLHLTKEWKKYATTCEIKLMSLRNDMEELMAENRRLKELVWACDAVAGPPVEQDGKSYWGSDAQECIEVKVEEAGETVAKKVQTGAAETGEGSGENMCKSCGKREMTFWGMPCSHACASPKTASPKK